MAEAPKADRDGWNATHWYEVQEGDRLSKIAKLGTETPRCIRASSKRTVTC